MNSILINICIFLFLNIPVGIIFHKAKINPINAFIPLKNVISYLRIVGFKTKYFIALAMILTSFFLCWDIYKGHGLYATGFFQGLGTWCELLLAIPTCMAHWFIFGISSIFNTLMCLVRAGDSCSLYHGATPLVFFGSIFMFIFLIIFYGKLAYKLALKFGWEPWTALLYMFFQPIAVWVLAFGKRKYYDDLTKIQNKNTGEVKPGIDSKKNLVSDDRQGQLKTSYSEVVDRETLILQEKKYDRFFRNTILTIFAVLMGVFLIKYIPWYIQTNAILREKQEERRIKTEKVVGELEKGVLDCDGHYDELYDYFGSKLPNDIRKAGYGVNGSLIKRETDGVCFEAYNLTYTDKIDGKDKVVSDYTIADYKTKETLFRCIESDFKIISLQNRGINLDEKKGCGALYDRMYKEYKHGFVAYDNDGNLKDYDDFDDEKLSKQLNKLNLQITSSCDKIFTTKGNTAYDRYYYLSGDNELILLGQLGHQRDDCDKYGDIIDDAVNGNIIVKEGYILDETGEIKYVGISY